MALHIHSLPTPVGTPTIVRVPARRRKTRKKVTPARRKAKSRIAATRSRISSARVRRKMRARRRGG